MSLADKLQDISPIGEGPEEDGPGRIDIDELDSEEMQDALEYLKAIGRDTTRKDIEEAAYYLRNVDDDAELYSAFETGEERGRIDRSLVAPNNMEKETKWHTRDGDFYQILTTTSLPRLVTPGWMVPITLSEHDARISMHIQPRDTSSVKGRLQQRLTQMKSAIQWKKRRGRTDVYEEEHERQELERLLRNVIEGTTKLFNLAFYMEIHGETLEEMEEASRVVQRKVSEQGMDLVPVEGRQIESQQSMIPVGTDPVKNNNTVQLEALATFFNFVEPPVNQPGGVLMGFDDSKRPVIVDRFALSGHSKVVTGKIGGGKTYSTKMAIYRRLLNDSEIRTIIFDPLGDDFVDFADKLGGQVIKFGGGDRINPLQIEEPTDQENTDDLYTTKVRSVIEILKTYFEQSKRGGMDAGEEGVITQAVHYAYAKNGITADPSTFSNESPIIDDVIEGVRTIAQGGIDKESAPVSDAMADGATDLTNLPGRTREIIKDPSDEHVKIAQQLVPKFESFKEGSVNNNLNGKTNIELDDRIVCFDMESFADTGEMPLIMHTMLDWAYQEARRSPRRTDVTFEEAHYLLNRSGARKLLNLFIRHARHFDAGLTLISQTPDEFLGNDEKKEIYDNCDIKQLFYQENVSPEVIEYFDCSEEEARFLRQAARGQNSNFSECLLSTSEHGRRRLEIYAGPYERHILEEDLDPHGYLRQQGLETETGTGNSANFDDEVMATTEQPAAPPGPVESREASSSSGQGHIDNPGELQSETYPQEEPDEPEDDSADEIQDPFRVQSESRATENDSETGVSSHDETRESPSSPEQRLERPHSRKGGAGGDRRDKQARKHDTEVPVEEHDDSSHVSPEVERELRDERDDEDIDSVDEEGGLLSFLPDLGGSEEESDSEEEPSTPENGPAPERNYDIPEDQESMVDELLGRETVQWLLKTLPIVVGMLLLGTAAIFYFT
jgi:hypothetical protein